MLSGCPVRKIKVTFRVLTRDTPGEENDKALKTWTMGLSAGISDLLHVSMVLQGRKLGSGLFVMWHLEGLCYKMFSVRLS